MKAGPLSKLPADISAGDWVVEEKYDGHRLIVQVSETLNMRPVKAWSRNGLERVLPPHIWRSLQLLPNGVYDGELRVPGERSYGVTVLEDAHKLEYVIFDVLELLGRDVKKYSWVDRRAYLEEIFRDKCFNSEHNEVQGCGSATCWKWYGKEVATTGVSLSLVWSVDSREEIEQTVRAVWIRGGEGLIIKHRKSIYEPGKRSKQWLKYKDLQSAVLTVIGYQAGLLGPHSVVVLRDEQGNETSVKTKNDAWRARLDAEPDGYVGEKLRVEFQERTPDGGYRHPRWDRWESE
jgi:ATP-dependent DNA ligase